MRAGPTPTWPLTAYAPGFEPEINWRFSRKFLVFRLDIMCHIATSTHILLLYLFACLIRF